MSEGSLYQELIGHRVVLGIARNGRMEAMVGIMRGCDGRVIKMETSVHGKDQYDIPTTLNTYLPVELVDNIMDAESDRVYNLLIRPNPNVEPPVQQ